VSFMDLFFYGALFCLGLFVLMGLVGSFVTLSWATRRIGLGSKEVYLASGDRAAVIQLLQRIRGAPDTTQALDEAITALQNRATIPAADVLPPPVSNPTATMPTPVAASTPSTATPVDAPPSSASPPVVTPPAQPAFDLRRWLALDNITLLLYLGAALFVIAVGVFVGSNWGEIGGLARWSIVAGSALAFFGLGEFFVRGNPVLARAGETFRSLGLVLLPLVALAYDRFVLDGDAPPLFWVLAGTALALLYYMLYRWSRAGRLTAYLSGLSLGIVALLLPDALGLASIWKAHALLVLAGALLAVTWKMEPDGPALLPRLLAGRASPLIESHLLLGALALLGSAAILGATWDAFPPVPLPNTSYFILLTALLAWVSLWFRSAWLVGAATLASGMVVWSAAQFVSSEVATWTLLLGWNALALALFVLAPFVERWIPHARVALTGGALLWTTAALLAITLPYDTPPSRMAAASLLATAFFAATAARFRTVVPFWPALFTLHIGILYALQLVRSDSDTLVMPTLIWLVLAALWLLADARLRPAWMGRFWAAAFAAEALWIIFFASWDAPAAALAGPLLVVGWLILAARRQEGWAASAAIVQSVYAIFAVAAFADLPSNLLPPLLFVPAAALVLATPWLPAYAQPASEGTALAVLLFSPVVGYFGEELGLPEPRWLGQTATAQVTLLLAAAFFVAWGWAQRRRPLVATGGVLLYLLYAWIALERDVTALQAYSVPLAVLLFAFAWLFPNQRRVLEVASAFVLLVPASFQSLGSDELLYSLLLGAWSLVLLGVGISLSRRVLITAGSVGLLLAALRQLWAVISALPPGVIIGLVGLVLMAVAILLTLRRDTLLRLRERGSDYWEQLGHDEQVQ
jgi:hypothetical protein